VRYLGGREFESRIEIAGVAPNHVDRFPDAIGTAALCVIKDKWAIHRHSASCSRDRDIDVCDLQRKPVV
jgi:hypothetical protein